MRSRTTLYALLFAVGLFVLPYAAHAANVIPFFGPIVPDAANRCAAGWGAVIQVINNIIRFLITLIVVFIAPLMLAYAGFMYVVNPVSPSNIQKAKDMMLNTVYGLIVALVGWMVVDAVMAVLYKAPDSTWASTWSELITSGGYDFCLIQDSLLNNLNQTNLGITGVTGQGGITTTAGPGQLISGFALGCTSANDLNARDLAGASVTGHSTANCCDKAQSTCTSLDGMSQSTIDQIKNIQNKCGGISVTGGTEIGHSSEGGTGSHSSGTKVDIGQNLISCILGTTGSASVNPPSFGTAQAKDKCGNIYTWEGNHTDIYVQSTCSL